jgi:hypothetical protein
VVIGKTDHGVIFGGFAPTSWATLPAGHQFDHSGETCIFILESPQGIQLVRNYALPQMARVKPNSGCSVFFNENYRPWFSWAFGVSDINRECYFEPKAWNYQKGMNAQAWFGLLCAEQVSGAKGHITPQMIEVWQCC